MKKKPDESDDDAPNTMQKTQHDLNQMYTGSEFQGEKTFSRMMSILMVIMFFSSGMPILYAVGFVYFLGTYVTHKVLLIRFYKKSSSLNSTIWLRTAKIMVYGILLNLGCSLFMLTNPSVILINENREKEGFLSD